MGVAVGWTKEEAGRVQVVSQPHAKSTQTHLSTDQVSASVEHRTPSATSSTRVIAAL